MDQPDPFVAPKIDPCRSKIGRVKGLMEQMVHGASCRGVAVDFRRRGNGRGREIQAATAKCSAARSMMQRPPLDRGRRKLRFRPFRTLARGGWKPGISCSDVYPRSRRSAVDGTRRVDDVFSFLCS